MQINEGVFFLISKLNKNVISLNAPFISLGRIKLSYFLTWKQYTWPVLFWNAIVKICNAFVYFLFLQSGLLLPHCRVILHFIELTDGTKEDRKEKHWKATHPPTSFQDSPHRTVTALLGVSQSSCGHKTPRTDSGLLPWTALLLVSRSEL